ITDASSGMKIGIPLRVTEKKEPFEANGLKGTRYRSNDGALALDVAAWPVAMQTLDQFLAQGLAAKPNRKVTYRLQRPDFIVMSGEENGRTFYTRAALHGGAVRGFTFSYPAARKGDFERVMLAIANSFDPFPGTAVAQPASPLPGATAPARPAGPVPLAAAARPRIAGVGVVTAPGRVLTSAAVLKASCTLTVRGMAVQVPGGDQRGLSVLQVAGLTAPAVTLAHSQSPPQPDEPLVAFGADGSGVILVSGAGLGGIGALRFTGGLGEGAAGAPVFNAAGALVGIVQEAPKAIAVASLGAAVARSHVMIAPLALGLDRAASDAPVSAGTLAARIAPSIVPIICAN
ncbi:MAG: trypsin-like peptidase domain-containing protein, partial [Beijerinckiaceae bacterium]